MMSSQGEISRYGQMKLRPLLVDGAAGRAINALRNALHYIIYIYCMNIMIV